MYEITNRKRQTRAFVSGTEFGRDISQIVWGAKSVKTIIFPNTVRDVCDGAFRDTTVLSAVLNEGLETLREHSNCSYDGVFRGTQLRLVKLPSTL